MGLGEFPEEDKNNSIVSIKYAENFTRQDSENLVELKAKRNSTDKSHQKDGEKKMKNVIRKNSFQREKALHKLSFEKKQILEKEKLLKEKKKANGEKAEILKNGRFCKVMKKTENQKPKSNKHDQLVRCNKDSNKMKREAEISINSPKVSACKTEIKDDSILLITAERLPCQDLLQNQHHELTIFKDVMDQQAQISKSYEVSERLTKTLNKGIRGEVEAGLPLSEKQQEHRKTETIEILSEKEINLKKIVMKSQLFLDTAKTLFRLNLPLNVINETSGSNNNEENMNLILDCGYELMKRKGRLQELSVHPFVKVPIISFKVKSLDHLVRQLNKEFEKLKVYGGDYYTRSLIQDYWPKVLERDIEHKDPNLNSMWDMGWNDLMFAFIEKDDVVRNLETEVFSGLLDEITRDLICI